ncbi:hypothetical protein HPB47_021911 [Ixodes persulcatus]|uniref:Uncharacterized protein n=1 Tax=Ixodes persulcatus TaxID=34615 RepID=A0AC60QB81_IXOPE|nr:hypothetical protein HPB47_021911 [Ixodes persulcatus]
MRVTYGGTPTVKTGRKRVTIERKEWDTVPSLLRIGGHWASFDYSDIKWVCRRCPHGHIQVNCTTEHCDQCAVFGHATDGFTSECRRCGGSHATVDCVGDSPSPSAQTGALTAPAKPQANIDPENSQSELSEGRRPPAPLPDVAGATFRKTERLVITEEESPAAEDPSLPSLGASPKYVGGALTAGTKDSTNSSDPSDPSNITNPSDPLHNSDPTNTRRGEAQDAKRVI